MKTIYQTKYQTENLEQSIEAADATASEIQKALSKHLTPLPEELLRLSLLCNQLAALEDAEIAIAIDTEANTATILLTAPCFLFQARQFILIQKITTLTSEIVFDVTEANNSQIAVTFDLSQMNGLLSRQYERLFESLQK